MESAGERLKKIRLQKGLSLEEVSKKTKIHLNILKNIEEDGIINLSPVYIKGFMKIYCKLLGVDPRDFITGYQEPYAQKTVVREERPPLVKTSLAKLTSFKLPFDPKTAARIAVIIVAVFLGFSFLRFVWGKIKSIPRKPKAVAVSKVPEKVPYVKEAAAARDTAKSAKTEKAVEIRLGMYAKENSWAEVKVDGKTVLRNVLKKGRYESWQAKDKIELSLGNAGGVELEVNTKRIPPLGRRGQAVKQISITRDGLRVGR
ncbi:MAG: RodZ domain-containing protein [Candidatus Omnitrophota bacterium]